MLHYPQLPIFRRKEHAPHETSATSATGRADILVCHNAKFCHNAKSAASATQMFGHFGNPARFGVTHGIHAGNSLYHPAYPFRPIGHSGHSGHCHTCEIAAKTAKITPPSPVMSRHSSPHHRENRPHRPLPLRKIGRIGNSPSRRKGRNLCAAYSATSATAHHVRDTRLRRKRRKFSLHLHPFPAIRPHPNAGIGHIGHSGHSGHSWPRSLPQKDESTTRSAGGLVPGRQNVSAPRHSSKNASDRRPGRSTAAPCRQWYLSPAVPSRRPYPPPAESCQRRCSLSGAPCSPPHRSLAAPG